MVQRGEDPGLALEAGEAVGVGGESFRKDLESHVPIELGVAGPVNLTHAACADLGGDFVRADARTSAEGHGHSSPTSSLNSTNQFSTTRSLDVVALGCF